MGERFALSIINSLDRLDDLIMRSFPRLRCLACLTLLGMRR
jgi:hypothetical protein